MVVGAGIVGLCAADALLRRGFRVTILERDARPGEGVSYGNGGLVVPSHFEPLAAPGMVLAGLRMLRSKESPFGFAGLPGLEMAGWMALFAQAGTHAHVARCAPVLRDLNLASRALFEDRYGALSAGYARKGELMVCRTAKGLAAEARLVDGARRLGLRTEVLDRQALADFERGIAYDAAGAVYFEDDAHLTPSLFMPALRERVKAAGAVIRDGATVEGFRTKDGGVEAIRLSPSPSGSSWRGSRGERSECLEGIEADEFVLAAGAWTGELARSLGLRIPLLAGKGYGFTVPNPPQTPDYPAILVDGRVAVTPMRDGLRFVGTMELGPPTVPKPNQARLRGMRRAIAEAYPAFRGFDLAAVPVWAGLRPCGPDGMPYLGRPRRLANVVVATGHGMMGLSLGPISGELVAQTLDGEEPSIPLALLDPDRYG